MRELQIRCIALDLDRTTLNGQGRLSAGNRRAIERAIENGDSCSSGEWKVFGFTAGRGYGDSGDPIRDHIQRRGSL